MIRTTLIAQTLALCLAGISTAQPLRPAPAPESHIDPSSVHPILRLNYYAGYEGRRWQEAAEIELVDWTPEKDVIITSKWLPRTGLTSPGARSPEDLGRIDPLRRRYARMPIHRRWIVEYIDAVEEGESHLFITAEGFPRVSDRIYAVEDVIVYHHIPSHGWYQVGRIAREMRFYRPPVPTQSPYDVRSR